MGKANEDEIMLMMGQQQQQNGLIRTIPMQINNHLIFIDDDIGDPALYRDVIHCLATCNDNDGVNFLINSNGGRTDSIWQIIEAMKGCRGDVAATVIGSAYSAASMLACMAPECCFPGHDILNLVSQRLTAFQLWLSTFTSLRLSL